MSLIAASSGALAHSMSRNTAFCDSCDCRSETFCRSAPRRVVALRGPRQVGGALHLAHRFHQRLVLGKELLHLEGGDAPLHGRGDKVVEVPRDVFPPVGEEASDSFMPLR